MMPFPAIGLWNMGKETELDCLYCNELWSEGILRDTAPTYKTFADLARHVLVDHNPQGISEEERIKLMKLDQNVLTKNPQLLPAMLANTGTVGKIVGVREAGKDYQFSDYVIDVQLKKTTYELPVKQINEDFRELARSLGLDTDKWVGKTIKLSTEPYTSGRSGKSSEIIRFELGK